MKCKLSVPYITSSIQYLYRFSVFLFFFYSILDLWSDDQDEGRWPGKLFSVLIAEASMDCTPSCLAVSHLTVAWQAMVALRV